MSDRDDATVRETPADVIARCAVLHTRRAARAVTAFFDAALQPSGVRATQFTLLVGVAQADGATISGLAAAVGMDRTTLARDLHILERDGLVAIGIGRDRRVRVVRLTPAGHAAMTRALPRWAEAQGRIEGGLGDERWRAVLDDLEATTAVADQG